MSEPDQDQNEPRIVVDSSVLPGPGYGFAGDEHQSFRVIGRAEYERLLREHAPDRGEAA